MKNSHYNGPPWFPLVTCTAFIVGAISLWLPLDAGPPIALWIRASFSAFCVLAAVFFFFFLGGKEFLRKIAIRLAVPFKNPDTIINLKTGKETRVRDKKDLAQVTDKMKTRYHKKWLVSFHELQKELEIDINWAKKEVDKDAIELLLEVLSDSTRYPPIDDRLLLTARGDLDVLESYINDLYEFWSMHFADVDLKKELHLTESE